MDIWDCSLWKCFGLQEWCLFYQLIQVWPTSFCLIGNQIIPHLIFKSCVENLYRSFFLHVWIPNYNSRILSCRRFFSTCLSGTILNNIFAITLYCKQFFFSFVLASIRIGRNFYLVLFLFLKSTIIVFC